MAKALLLLTDKDGELESLTSELRSKLNRHLDNPPHVTIQLMEQMPGDIFYRPGAPYPRYPLVLEIVTSPGKPMSSLHDTLRQILERTPLDRAASLALLMQERKFLNCLPQEYYYHQLMIKRPEYSAADYMDYYSNYHCRMGIHTPAIAGYSQNYIDQAGSAQLASALGLGCREVTSISELKIPDLKQFVTAPGLIQTAVPAAIDEERFIDRTLSIAFSSRVILRLGDFENIDAAIFEQHFPG